MVGDTQYLGGTTRAREETMQQRGRSENSQDFSHKQWMRRHSTNTQEKVRMVTEVKKKKMEEEGDKAIYYRDTKEIK